ncbi:flagellar hook capping protein [Burkholderia ubonensis]|uniref:Basal-body rod modification protein FlgD n=1 Tax=Burkholderia ubonensis TaxID=101571 RepID=A0ABD6Q7A1_9BURK|nr:flagellar hook capping FlgD N-terminal domain-containing protein [Burkholderia ubonensis]KVC83866.1 flagellar hook capping protein [Burkholderia ubonensis]KVO18846.1 flagellar hook capping protein [Burkholderia ubonensis]KVO19551.1 flagellar hook capping protein [Burkholderia ubonensis]KVP56752.1 flagellar hook capping protein [Burkholderia ubonensis]KVQ80260.1 flagellar hook capping protein [Burkholderia ubonensis]
MALDSIGPVADSGTQTNPAGLDLQSLLRIIVTQLTYQDPLKPVDNYEFVSQLAQFTSLEQSRQIASKIDDLLSVQSATQTLGLLGRKVDVRGDAGTISGVVKGLSFKNGEPKLTIESENGQFLADASVSQILTVR